MENNDKRIERNCSIKAEISLPRRSSMLKGLSVRGDAIRWMGIFIVMLMGGFEAIASDLFQVWNAGAEMRITPSSYSRDLSSSADAETFRNEIVDLQFAARSESSLQGFAVTRVKETETSASLPDGWVRIYYPGYLLADEIGGYTSDPLMEKSPGSLKAGWTQAVWIQVRVPAEARAGRYVATFAFQAGGEEKRIQVRLNVLDFVLPNLTDGKFYLNIWQDPGSVARWAKVPLWSERHWKLLDAYARDMASHGQRSITTSILYDPWHSQAGHIYPSMVEWQYLGVWQGKDTTQFRFDYSAFDRYVELMMRAGVKESILCVSMVDGPGHSPDCDIGYKDTASGLFRIRHTEVGDPLYRQAWNVFLPAFVKHLKEKGWLGKTFIAFDEKPQEIMNTILEVLKGSAPELKISLSGGSSSQRSASAEELTVYVDDLANRESLAKLLAQRRKVGPTMYYTACAPALPNTFLYSPLYESRMLPWIAWDHGLNGYLRWAYQSWPDRVWQQPLYRWHSGDMYFVYPGENGPITTTRWEMMRQGVQDYEALKMLEAQIDRIREDRAKAPLAEKMTKELHDIVADAVELHRCEGVASPGVARHKINQLLLQSTGKAMNTPSPYTSNLSMDAKFSPEGFVPDGNLDKEVWKKATRMKFDHDWSGKHHFPEAETEVASFWTATHVYFAFWCKYQKLNIYEGEEPAKERWELWERDVVEVFANPQPERVPHYYEFEVAPNNQWIDLEIDKEKAPFNDAGWDSHFDHATRVDSDQKIWTCEMRIPVSIMNSPVMRAGAEWRINFFRADGFGGDNDRRFLAWSPIGGTNPSFHAPERFGLIRFVK